MGNATKGLMEGDRVVQLVHFAATLPPKRHEGIVVDVGKKGVQVKFDGPLGVKWVPIGKLDVVRRASTEQTAIVRQAPEPARVEQRPIERARPVLVPPPAPAPTQETVRNTASDLEAWREMGRGLVDAARERVFFAEQEAEVKQEAMKLAAEEYQAARKELDSARADLKHLEGAVG